MTIKGQSLPEKVLLMDEEIEWGVRCDYAIR
jgi:hypothetical protein